MTTALQPTSMLHSSLVTSNLTECQLVIHMPAGQQEQLPTEEACPLHLPTAPLLPSAAQEAHSMTRQTLYLSEGLRALDETCSHSVAGWYNAIFSDKCPIRPPLSIEAQVFPAMHFKTPL